jgi:hypothetical protein
MTEDDTFNALKRSTFDVVHNEWVDIYRTDADVSLDTILKKNGWTRNEFHIEYEKRQNDRRCLMH